MVNPKINWFIYLLLVPMIAYQIQYLALRMDNTILWFYRFLSGGIFLILFCLVLRRREMMKLLCSKRVLLGLLIYTSMLIVGSFATSEGIKLTNATTCNLLASTGLPLTMGMAYAIWGEEGDLLKDFFFQIGVVIILIGVLGFSLSGTRFSVGNKFFLGTLILLGAVINNCLSTLIMRHLLRNNDPVATSGVSMLMACIVLFIPAYMKGGMNVVFTLPMETVGVLFLSGIFGALVGLLLALQILKKSGVAVYNLLKLPIPVVSAIMGLLILGETFGLEQLLFGTVLLAGCYLCLSRKKINRKVQRP